MTKWLRKAKQWSLAAAASATFLCGVFALTSCGGEGGPVGDGSNGGGDDAIAKQFLALLPAGQKDAKYVGASKCGECHNGGEEGVYAHWQDTKHANVNVGCEQCHGPGSKHAAAPSKDTIMGNAKVSSPVVCGQCHGPIYRDYKASPHNEIIADPVHEAVINPNQYARNSRCFTCHSGLVRQETWEKGIDPANLTDAEIEELVHEVLHDEGNEEEGIPPVTDWNLKNDANHSAMCSTCHNPHKQTGNLTDDGKEVQLRQPVSNLDTSPVAPGATAQTATQFKHICAQCHNGRGAGGTDDRLSSTSRPNMHDSNQYNTLMGIGGAEGNGPPTRTTAHSTIPGQCSTCHMPNARHTFTVSFEGGCQPCHSAGDAAARTLAAKTQITELLFELKTKMEAWAQAKFGDPALWDYTSLLSAAGKTAPDQSLVPMEVRRARHNYYFVVRDGSFGVHNLRYTRFLLQVALNNMNAAAPGVKMAPMPSASERLGIFIKERERAKKSAHADVDGQ